MITLDPTGAITKDGVVIGRLDTGVCYSAKPIPGVVKGQIRKALKMESLEFEVSEGVPPSIPPASTSATPQPTPTPTTTPQGEEIMIPPSQVQLDVDVITKRVAAGEIPPPPPTISYLGDKDPAYVEWYRKHATPEQFHRRYAHRKLPSLAQADEGERRRTEHASKAGGDFQISV